MKSNRLGPNGQHQQSSYPRKMALCASVLIIEDSVRYQNETRIQIQEWTNVLIFFGEVVVLSTLDANSDDWKVDIDETIATRQLLRHIMDYICLSTCHVDLRMTLTHFNAQRTSCLQP